MQSFTTFLSTIILLTSISPLSHSITVPSYPTPTTNAPICKLDLSNELFGGVSDACSGYNLDRNRCCPVLAAWLFAAHARRALEITSPVSSSAELPITPDDSQKCVNSLQDSLRNRNIVIPQPNASCDAILCFCGIRLHQISSLSCPTAFNVSLSPLCNVSAGSHNATPTAKVRELEKNCRNSSYAGCTKCLGTLQKLKEEKNERKESERARKMFNRDCQLMALTWLLGRNKTAYIPTVSAVLRAILYSSHPHESKCSPDHENMPLAVDSLQFNKSQAPSQPFILLFSIVMTLMTLLQLLPLPQIKSS